MKCRRTLPIAAQISGIDIVGSGATPPTTITLDQGKDLGWTHAEASCNKSRKCRSFNSTRCQVNGTGVQCRETLTSRLRRGKQKKCKQNILYTAEGGTIASSFRRASGPARSPRVTSPASRRRPSLNRYN